MIKIFEKFNEPEVQYWYNNGRKFIEEWTLNGKWHREDGPAYQRWTYDNGQELYKDWYLNGVYYNRKEWVEELGKIGSKHYREQLLLYNMEKYNL